MPFPVATEAPVKTGGYLNSGEKCPCCGVITKRYQGFVFIVHPDWPQNVIEWRPPDDRA